MTAPQKLRRKTTLNEGSKLEMGVLYVREQAAEYPPAAGELCQGGQPNCRYTWLTLISQSERQRMEAKEKFSLSIRVNKGLSGI